jgi:ATP-binding protein involved in chromosome partitioning
MSSPLPTREQVLTALADVNDPEIGRPITELGMVKSVEISPAGEVAVGVYLTVAGCPMRDTITSRVTAAVTALPGATGARVELDVMSEQQRRELQATVRGSAAGAADAAERVIPFAQPSSLTKVYAIVSGKGGVGKSSVTVNLAAALAAAGHKVGLIDADIYGHSVPRMLGATGLPTKVQDMIMPPSARGVKVVSAGMLKPPGQDALPIRGPILHRLFEQFLADFYWGDLDYLLIDMPPGTGDVALSLARLVPGAELVIVTTPQVAAAEVAKRAGTLVTQTHQRVVGVIENMSYLTCPHCGEPMDVFGSGGGETVAADLTRLTGTEVPLLGQIPLDVRLREGGDSGTPLILSDPSAPASIALSKVAESLVSKGRGLAGRMLSVSPR